MKIVLKDAETADIVLYSLDGRPLANFRNQSEVQIATSKLPAGAYVVKVTVNNIVKTMTVIKKQYFPQRHKEHKGQKNFVFFVSLWEILNCFFLPFPVIINNPVLLTFLQAFG